MILANINDNAYIFNSWEQFNKAVFNPLNDWEVLELGAIKGKTYSERKKNARQKAIDYSLTTWAGLSWGEVAEIQAYFEKLAVRFGLVTEFKENAII